MNFATTEKAANSMTSITKRPNAPPTTPPAKRMSIFGARSLSSSPLQGKDHQTSSSPNTQTTPRRLFPPLTITTPSESEKVDDEDNSDRMIGQQSSSSDNMQREAYIEDFAQDITTTMDQNEGDGESGDLEDPKGKRPSRSINRRR
jgi:hypothetical protein